VGDDGRFAHCTREEYAGSLRCDGAGTFAHLLNGLCLCGLAHGVGFDHVQTGDDERDRADADGRIEYARRVWAQGRPIAGTIAANYLRARGITIVPGPTELRFDVVKHTPTGHFLPAMIAPMRNAAGVLVGLHRTFLAEDGRSKSKVIKPKMMLGMTKGATIRFGEGAEIALAEGVENALSVREATGMPAWAAGSLSGLKNVILPPFVEHVVIVADPKPHEIAGAEEAARRFLARGCRAEIAYPIGDKDANETLTDRSS
jgi:hypothetical protein